MYRHIITQSPNGYDIYVNLIASPAGHYLGRQPYVINLLKEVLEPMNLTDNNISFEHEMGRVIGSTDIIETSDKDTIFYAQPYKKNNFSRYARNRNPAPSTKLTIIMDKDADGNYELTDTWIGPCSPPFPGEENETEQSKIYWQNHALAQDAEVIQSKTITKICPY